MRQAEAPPSGKWTGPSHAGVKAPDPILLPDPARRFAATAQRLEQLAAGHPMEAWLRFVAVLARAQHEVATTLAPAATLDPPVVGSFEKKIGHFFARDTYQGQNIVVVFRWDARNPQRPIWSQAFSTDEGKTWEWNSINVSERAAH